MSYFCKPCGESHGTLANCRRPDLHVSTNVDTVKRIVDKSSVRRTIAFGYGMSAKRYQELVMKSQRGQLDETRGSATEDK